MPTRDGQHPDSFVDRVGRDHREGVGALAHLAQQLVRRAVPAGEDPHPAAALPHIGPPGAATRGGGPGGREIDVGRDAGDVHRQGERHPEGGGGRGARRLGRGRGRGRGRRRGGGRLGWAVRWSVRQAAQRAAQSVGDRAAARSPSRPPAAGTTMSSSGSGAEGGAHRASVGQSSRRAAVSRKGRPTAWAPNDITYSPVETRSTKPQRQIRSARHSGVLGQHRAVPLERPPRVRPVQSPAPVSERDPEVVRAVGHEAVGVDEAVARTPLGRARPGPGEHWRDGGRRAPRRARSRLHPPGLRRRSGPVSTTARGQGSPSADQLELIRSCSETALSSARVGAGPTRGCQASSNVRASTASCSSGERPDMASCGPKASSRRAPRGRS